MWCTVTLACVWAGARGVAQGFLTEAEAVVVGHAVDGVLLLVAVADERPVVGGGHALPELLRLRHSQVRAGLRIEKVRAGLRIEKVRARLRIEKV